MFIRFTQRPSIEALALRCVSGLLGESPEFKKEITEPARAVHFTAFSVNKIWMMMILPNEDAEVLSCAVFLVLFLTVANSSRNQLMFTVPVSGTRCPAKGFAPSMSPPYISEGICETGDDNAKQLHLYKPTPVAVTGA